uniref:DC-UbP/UBTD2 N-terminal domain-containing protein n=1 Tax=Nelumbo nucifera TaxID=4432 RepID=A0A822YLX5_NELNU|nr:TPA_asm: hypothetical protein HUJ06_010856 [Nelumbo nucifera]
MSGGDGVDFRSPPSLSLYFLFSVPSPNAPVTPTVFVVRPLILSSVGKLLKTRLDSETVFWGLSLRSYTLAWFAVLVGMAGQLTNLGALFSAFLAMHLASGVHGVLAALALAYNTNLFGALTHYSSEIWDALRAAAEADLTLAQAIVNSAGVIVTSADLTTCYDERSAKYELPKYVLSEPTNMIRDN